MENINTFFLLSNRSEYWMLDTGNRRIYGARYKGVRYRVKGSRLKAYGAGLRNSDNLLLDSGYRMLLRDKGFSSGQ